MRNLVKAVRELQKHFASASVMKMRVLSNQLIDEAAFENDKRIAAVALIGYSLHKLSSKEHIVGHDKWLQVKRRVLVSLDRAAISLEQGKEQEFDRALGGIVREITAADSKMGNFVQGIFEKAKIKYASNAYSLGLSLSQAAELTGASKKNVLEYIGATKISDREEAMFGIAERLRKLKKMM